MKTKSKWLAKRVRKPATFLWPSDERKLQSHELKSLHTIESEPLKAVTANLVNLLAKTYGAHDVQSRVTWMLVTWTWLYLIKCFGRHLKVTQSKRSFENLKHAKVDRYHFIFTNEATPPPHIFLLPERSWR